MGREVFLLKLSKVTPGKKDGDKATTSPVYIGMHHIQAMVPTSEGTDILLTSGVAYTVVETPEQIERMGQTYGTLKFIK